jgi:hypothetical protein
MKTKNEPMQEAVEDSDSEVGLTTKKGDVIAIETNNSDGPQFFAIRVVWVEDVRARIVITGPSGFVVHDNSAAMSRVVAVANGE